MHVLTFGFLVMDLNSVCNDCHDLTTLSLKGVKGVDHYFIVHDIIKSEATGLLENFLLKDRGNI